MSGGKPRGLNAARKLRNNRREQRWADLHYKKRALGTAFKSRYAIVRAIPIEDVQLRELTG